MSRNLFGILIPNNQYIYITPKEAGDFLYSYTCKRLRFEQMKPSNRVSTFIEALYQIAYINSLTENEMVKEFLNSTVDIYYGLESRITTMDELTRYLRIYNTADKKRHEQHGINNNENDREETSNMQEDVKNESGTLLEQINEKMGSISWLNQDDGQLDVSQVLKLYDGIPVRYQDNFFIKYSGPKIINKKLILLADNNRKIVAAGKLIEDGNNKYHGVFDKNNIDYEAFRRQESYKLILFVGKKPKSYGLLDMISIDVVVKECKVEYNEPKETDRILCVDFGSNNTTAGSYGIKSRTDTEPDLVRFYNKKTNLLDERFPTAVGILNCSDEKNIRYMFGYDVNIYVRKHKYNFNASVFYEIKRWINEIDTEITVKDEEGNTCRIKQGEVIKAYLENIIQEAEYHFKVKFKKLHFSAPAKMKMVFLTRLSALLDDYEVLTKEEETVDEGVAIIYNYLSNLVSRVSGKTTGTLNIIDCGGGTTDYAKCTYEIVPYQQTTTLKMNTVFENGNTNFGGNSITFRIMQFLKIRLANYFKPELVPRQSIQELLPYTDDEILTKIDNKIPNGEIYRELNVMYDAAENVIPTKFAKQEFVEHAKKVKRNFYYLWQMAEYIKTEFYKNEDKIGVSLSDSDHQSKNNIDMSDILNDYTLYVYKNSELTEETKLPNIEINLQEVRKLIYGDIYEVLNDMLGDYKQDKSNRVKLSGQSCRIGIFNHLMREFIVGKLLRSAHETKENKAGLKLDCVKGCINFTRDRQDNDITHEITSEPPKLIYTIKVPRKNETTDILKPDKNKYKFDFSCFNAKAQYITLIVENNKNEVEKEIEYCFREENEYQELSSNEDIVKQLTDYGVDGEMSKKIVEKIEKANINELIGNASSAIFLLALPAADQYGFNIYAIKRETVTEGKTKANKFSMAPIQSENYETNIASQKYFDGNR